MPLAFGAADFPEKTVKFVVPYAPGGPNDFMARLVGQKLTEMWGQSVVVENRPGAGGNTGTAFVAKAKPDGYTVLVTTSTVAANMSLYSNPGYELEKELIAVDTHLFLNGTAAEEICSKLLSISEKTCYLHATASNALLPRVGFTLNGDRLDV